MLNIIQILVEIQAKVFIASEGYNPKYGARELRRVVEKLVQIPLSELILAGKLEKGSKWELTQQEETLLFRITI